MEDRRSATERWGSESFFFTEAARGGPLIWRAGAQKLDGDELGPVRHAHDDAGEYYFMFSGSALVETGGEEFVLEEGQLGYIPPHAPHNFLGPASDEDACLFCVVAPNLVDNKWRVRDFRRGSEGLRMSVARPWHDDELPGGGTLSAQALTLRPGDDPVELRFTDREAIYLVVEGALDIELQNGLRGPVPAGSYVHVRNETQHRISASHDARVLRLDCGFVPWQGVPTAEDA